MRTTEHWGWGIVLSLVLALIVAGCGKDERKTGPPPPPEVAVVTVQTRPLIITTELTGRTAASLVAEVRPQVNGIVQRRLFTEGADVRAGQELYRIDAAVYQAALENARAALGRAEANLPAIRLKASRVRELLADKAVSQQDVDDTTAAVNQTEADVRYWKSTVAAAAINVRYTSVTAPISGRIGRSTVTEGALVTAHQPLALATIQRLDPIYVDVPQSTTELLRLRRRLEDGGLRRSGQAGNKVRLVLDDGSAYPWQGRLQFRDVTVDATTGSVILRVDFPNPQGILLPGMFVRALVEEGVNPRAILIPQQAVTRDPKGNAVALVVDADGIVRQRQLTVERGVDDAWLVSAGLAPGERVIVEGAQKARPGAPVKAVPFTPAPAAAGGPATAPAAPAPPAAH